MNICKSSIGRRIREALETRGIRPADLAERLGVSRAAVSCWLKGEKLSVNQLCAISTELDVSLNWLVLALGSPNIAADAAISTTEEDMIRLLRYFGDDAVQTARSMVSALAGTEQPPLKRFKAYDLISRTEMPILVLDATGHLVFSNIYHNRLLGLDEEAARQLQGRHFTDWVPKVFHRKFRSILQDTLRKGYTTFNSMHITCPVTHQERKLIIHSRAVTTANGPGAQLLIRSVDNVLPA